MNRWKGKWTGKRKEEVAKVLLIMEMKLRENKKKYAEMKDFEKMNNTER